ncbi:phage terminase small subunit [Tepidibacter aestuarii]|uniref:phage terminase small subunit n=1 Tax=Tepidibacter aestuarii TaxID=2925782 RepID=UPI0020C1888E|nr:phage terminase small subunit [Tepidibacter aestuarii]CAH2213510.1 conserved protein of unknown function [Tepidibacter aestuarii]
MARARSPNRDKAFEIYKSHGGNIDLVERAKKLDVSPGSVRGWKNKDKWEDQLNGTLQKNNKKNTERYKRKKGSQPGNKNAKESSGGPGGPVGNKKALTTGEFESIFFDTLEEDEKQLINSIEIEKRTLIQQEIQLITIRERRMLKRINDLKQYDFTVVKKDSDKGIGPMGEIDKVGEIQRIEEALTRVQDKKSKLISELHKWEMDHEKFELEKTKVMGDSEESGDDGFLKVLKGMTAEVWADEEK